MFRFLLLCVKTVNENCRKYGRYKDDNETEARKKRKNTSEAYIKRDFIKLDGVSPEGKVFDKCK